MGHYGKHIIDPETGLCEICDREAIRDIRRGNQPKKQLYYSSHDDGLNYRPNRNETSHHRNGYDTNDEQVVHEVHKPVHTLRTDRPRRIVYEQPAEEPVIVRRKIIRRPEPPPSPTEPTPRHQQRTKAFYYVDDDGQMVSQSETPPLEPPRRYIVRARRTPPERTYRIARRRIEPSSPQVETVHSRPRRLINSDTEVLERQQRAKQEDINSHPKSQKQPILYHIEGSSRGRPHSRTSLESLTQVSHRNGTPPPREVYDDDDLPIRPRVKHIEPTQPGERRVYRKLPPGKTLPPDDKPIGNGVLTKNARNRPPPPTIRRNIVTPEPVRRQPVYQTRPDDRY